MCGSPAGLYVGAGGTGQAENKLSANVLGTDNVNVFPVGLNDLLYNSKSQPGPLFILAPGNVGLIEPIPNFFQIFFWNPDAAVLYGDKNFLPSEGSLDINDSAVVAKLNGIINKILKYLMNIYQIRIKHLNRIGKG